VNCAPPAKPTYLNVGCGGRFCKGEPWINLDVGSADPAVRPWDVRAGLPLEANSVDVVYLSHVLEHFAEAAGARLAAECQRVLKPGGIVRVVVPDLEGICREYLRQLDEIRTSPPGHPGRLAWIKLELLDQCARHESGGGMKMFFREQGLSEVDYVVDRIGTVGLQLAKAAAVPVAAGSGAHRRGPASLRDRLLNVLLRPAEAEALRIGQFRTRGEVHLCMYESVSLEQVLRSAGFEEVCFHQADTSQIADWACHHLDRDPDGREHAPHSLYAEARKHRA
jgi:predicted SAM-dependent methyltransferase